MIYKEKPQDFNFFKEHSPALFSSRWELTAI